MRHTNDGERCLEAFKVTVLCMMGFLCITAIWNNIAQQRAGITEITICLPSTVIQRECLSHTAHRDSCNNTELVEMGRILIEKASSTTDHKPSKHKIIRWRRPELWIVKVSDDARVLRHPDKMCAHIQALQEKSTFQITLFPDVEVVL